MLLRPRARRPSVLTRRSFPAPRDHEAPKSCACARGKRRDKGFPDRTFVEFRLEVDGGLSVRDGHGIVDAAERAIAALFAEETEVIGHLEPATHGR
ncbi:MAG: cation transporter dimerization domain-containing protein [Steroidobacteraceae bacterium]